jgi:hypothetical protein
MKNIKESKPSWGPIVICNPCNDVFETILDSELCVTSQSLNHREMLSIVSFIEQQLVLHGLKVPSWEIFEFMASMSLDCVSFWLPSLAYSDYLEFTYCDDPLYYRHAFIDENDIMFELEPEDTEKFIINPNYKKNFTELANKEKPDFIDDETIESVLDDYEGNRKMDQAAFHYGKDYKECLRWGLWGGFLWFCSPEAIDFREKTYQFNSVVNTYGYCLVENGITYKPSQVHKYNRPANSCKLCRKMRNEQDLLLIGINYKQGICGSIHRDVIEEKMIVKNIRPGSYLVCKTCYKRYKQEIEKQKAARNIHLSRPALFDQPRIEDYQPKIEDYQPRIEDYQPEIIEDNRPKLLT